MRDVRRRSESARAPVAIAGCGWMRRASARVARAPLARTRSAIARFGCGGILICFACLVAVRPAHPQNHPLRPSSGDPGPTPGELTDFKSTPTYSETMQYIAAAAAKCGHIEVASCGSSVEGRALPLVFVRDQATGDTSWDDGSDKPVVLIIAGIHPDEVDGKDALLMLLRDIARGREPDIVANLRLVIVPIFNVDGHENFSRFHRFTQVGPEGGMGTRRNAVRLDLNRDFTKLDTPECRALVRLGSQFQPDIFIDLHTNDGFDHQYDVLYGIAVDPTLPGDRDRVAREGLLPAITAEMQTEGFRGHPIAYPVDEFDITKGLATYGLDAKLATGYFESRQSISILSESHPYVSHERRVRATLALLRGALRYAAARCIELPRVVAESRRQAIQWSREPGVHALALGCSAEFETSRPILWLGKVATRVTSPVTGQDYARYLTQPIEVEVPFYDHMRPNATVLMPRGYLIQRPWRAAAERLRDHCITVQMLREPFTAEVETFRATAAEFAARPSQGRHPITKLEGEYAPETRTFPAGSFWVPLDQPGGITAIHLLEAKSPVSFLTWNLFDSIFERGIILEDWALEENALRLLENPDVRAEYDAAVRDSAFANDPRARLDFFFAKTPFVEEGENLYPVHRVLGAAPEHISDF